MDMITFVQKFLVYKNTSKCIKIFFQRFIHFVLSNTYIYLYISVHIDSQFKGIISLNALLKIYTYCSFNDLCIFLLNLGN